MGNKANSPPPPPDPYAVSQAQTGSNINTAVGNSILGNANTIDPYGSTTFLRSSPSSGGSSVYGNGYGNSFGNGYGTGGGMPAPTQMVNGQPFGASVAARLRDNPQLAQQFFGGGAGGSPGGMGGGSGNGSDSGGGMWIDGNYVPQFTKITTLAPAQQQMLDLKNQTGIGLNQLALNQTHAITDLLSHPVNTNGLSDFQGAQQAPNFNGLPNGPQMQVAQLQGQGAERLPIQGNVPVDQQSTNFGQTSGQIVNSVGPQDFSADRQAVTDAYLARMNPQLDRDRASLENQLVNQGFARGTAAFDTQMDQANRQANDARSQAILAGGQEQSRLAGLQLNQAQFANQAQGQDYSQQQGRGLFGLQATGANNAANLAGGQFGNAAAGQDFAQQQAKQAFDNAVAQGNAAGANDAAMQAYQNSVAQTQYGNTNAQQGFTNNTANAQLNNQVRAQGLQERFGLSSFPINQITALMSGGQIQAPQSVQYAGGSIAPTNVSGNVYNSAALDQQNYATQAAQQNAAMGGLFGLGSAALMGGMNGGTGGFGSSLFGTLANKYSDRRLKRDIIDTGIRLMNGLRLYSYRYLWDTVERIGLMADEVAKVKPAAVFNVCGYDAVNYDMAMEAA